MRNALMFVAVSGVLAGASMAATIHVDDDAPNDPGPGTPAVSDPLEDGSAAHPFDSIQEAILASSDGDVIEVAAGTYTGGGNRALTYSGRAVTVRGAGDATIIDLQGTSPAVTFVAQDQADTRLERVQIINGAGPEAGVAIRCMPSANPTIAECRIASHVRDRDTITEGGAMWIAGNASATLIDCRFENNRLEASNGMNYWMQGAALCVAPGGTVVIQGCQFVGNVVESPLRSMGGALYAEDAIIVTASTFESNLATAHCFARGGAVYIENEGSVFTGCSFVENRAVAFICGANGGATNTNGTTFVACRFEDNETEIGNARHTAGAAAEWNAFDRCAFINNTSGSGGAVGESGRPGSATTTTVRNSLFAGNVALGDSYTVFKGGETYEITIGGRGGAIHFMHVSDSILNCTFVDNVADGTFGTATGGAFSTFQAGPTVRGSILRGNLPDSINGAADVTYSNLPGGLGLGNVDVDPNFVDAANGDYRLAAGSPCIDAASSLVDLGPLDLAGAARAVDDAATPDTGEGPAPLPDMGAYEYQGRSCVADLDDSGDVGFNDLVAVLAAWGPCAGCAADLNGDDAVSFDDLLVVLSAWGPCL